MCKKIIILSLLLLGTTACVTNPKIADVSKGVKDVTFVQHGNEPLKYTFGVVDGKSFWASADTSSVGDVAGVGAQLAASTVSAAAGDAVEAEKDKVPAFMKKMIDGYPVVDNFSKEIFPAVARSWHQPYSRKKLKTVPVDVELEDKDGYYKGPGQNSDLVLALAVENVTLTEKPTLGGAFAAAFTAGFNAKTVVPIMTASVTAYKKDVQSGRMKRVWRNYCSSYVLGIDGGMKFPDLEKDPKQGRPMIVESAQSLDKQCLKMSSVWE